MPKTARVEIIGAVNPAARIDKNILSKALVGKAKTLQHGEAFTGKPSTAIILSPGFVVKLRKELKFIRPEDSKRWIERNLKREQNLNVHHPSKTWFLLSLPDRLVVGNITPELTPLHVLHNRHEDIAPYLGTLFDRYFQLARDFKKRLDEGLSNFGIDSEQQLYYLDDDIYDWDDYLSFSQILGVWIRSHTTLSDETFKAIGSNIQTAILKYFEDPHEVTAFDRLLNDLLFTNAEQISKLSAIRAGLDVNNTHKQSQSEKRPDTARKERYRLALIADIHANLPALEVTLEKIRSLNVDRILLLGDLVGYGPHPSECIQAIQAEGIECIKGNHDHALSTGDTYEGISSMAKWAIEWSLDHVSDDDRHWLAQLPPSIKEEDWLAVHGAPIDKRYFYAYVYHMTYTENLDYLNRHQIRLAFHGHTHIRGAYLRQGQHDQHLQTNVIQLSDANAALICPGSVGQTRSRVPEAEFAVYDSGVNEVQFHQLDYDLQKTIDDMKKYDFPIPLITRLEQGQ